MIKIIKGDALENIKLLENKSVNCIMTSLPCWKLRDYGVDEQIRLENTAEEFLEKLMNVFNECWRVLKDTGTLFVNLGDTYSNINSKFVNGSNDKDYNTYKQIIKKRDINVRKESKMMISERFAINMIENG